MTISPELAEEIQQMPVLSSVLPYRFSSGSVISAFDIMCGSCGEKKSQDHIRGKFEPVAGGSAAYLRAYAVCLKCRTITPLEAQFHDDGIVLFHGPTGWKKSHWGDESRKIRQVVINILESRWEQILPPFIASVILVIWAVFKND